MQDSYRTNRQTGLFLLPIKSKQTNISHEVSGKVSGDKTLRINRNVFIRIQVWKPMLITLLYWKIVFFLETTLCNFFRTHPPSGLAVLSRYLGIGIIVMVFCLIVFLFVCFSDFVCFWIQKQLNIYLKRKKAWTLWLILWLQHTFSGVISSSGEWHGECSLF